MKTIVHFVPELNEGGAEKLVCDYCYFLKKDGYNVVLFEIFPPYDSISYRKIKKMNIPLYYVYPQKSKFFLMINKYFGKKYIPYKLKKMIDKVEPHAIHLHLSWLRFFVLMTDYIKDKSIKLYYTCHNTPPYYFSGRKEPEFYAAKSMLAQNALQLIALSPQMQSELNDMFSINNTVVIHNAIEAEQYGDNALPKNKIRHKLGIDANAFVVGNIGRFTEQKNHDYLITVFYELQKKQDNAFLLLIGSGELKESIEKKIHNLNIEDKVLILSGRTDIPDLLNAMDVFVFPSLYEGLGIALIEAQFSGLKCVTADCVPLEAYITNKVITLSVKDSIERWVEAILSEEYSSDRFAEKEDYIMSKEIKRLEMLYEN